MILKSLTDFARREGLLADPDYEPKPVAWIIQIADGGSYVGLIPTGEGKRLNIPRRVRRTSKALPDFLVDKSEYVLGACRQDKLTKLRSPEELAKRHEMFRANISTAHESTGAAALRAVADFLSNEDQRCRCAMDAEAAGYQNNDLFAFQYGGSLVHELAEVREYFSKLRAETSNSGVPCLVCGRERVPVDKQPVVRVPGGSSSGVALVSFNWHAAESYGLSRNQNAPVCRECADAYTTALNRCLDRGYVDQSGNVLSRRSVRLCSDTAAVYWAEAGQEIVDLFGGLLDTPTPEAAEYLLSAPYKGYPPAVLGARFYCLLISGAEGRATIRGLQTQSLGDAERNVRKYFQTLDVGQQTPFPLWALVRSLALQGKADNLSPNLAGDFFVAILFGRPFPRALLSAAVARCRAERKIPRERAAILRAFLIRNCQIEVAVSLDKDNREPGYRLGRLLAILERLRADAQNNPNKTIVDRYYGVASTRPATVFPPSTTWRSITRASFSRPDTTKHVWGKCWTGSQRSPQPCA
jgi:CRISPR-associated protein Csd1